MNYDCVAFADVSEQCFELRALGVLAAALVGEYLFWAIPRSCFQSAVLGFDRRRKRECMRLSWYYALLRPFWPPVTSV